MSADVAVGDRLLAELDRLPARSSSAVEVLWMVNDPRVSAAQLAQVAAGDEALTTRLMRMANSPFYGLSGRVASADFAITVLGFDTVRAVAASAAAGVLHDAVPPWMLRRSTMTAAAAGLLAPHVGLGQSEATSLGLLHNLGSMLLHRCDRAGHAGLVEQARREGTLLEELERARFGAPGHDLAAVVLRRWSFPADFVEALTLQCEPLGVRRTPLGRVLVAARAAMETLVDGVGDDAVAERRSGALRLVDAGPEVVERLRRDADGLLVDR